MGRDPGEGRRATRLAAWAVRRRLLTRPRVMRALDGAFRRDIALFRWGVDSIDQLLDVLGLQYRERPRMDVLSGKVVIVGAHPIHKRPSPEAAREYVRRGGCLVTTGVCVELAKAAFPAAVDIGRDEGSDAPTTTAVAGSRLAWALGDIEPRWCVGPRTPWPLARPGGAANVRLEDDRGRPLCVEIAEGTGRLVHFTGLLVPAADSFPKAKPSPPREVLEALGASPLDDEEVREVLAHGEDVAVRREQVVCGATACAAFVDILAEALG